MLAKLCLTESTDYAAAFSLTWTAPPERSPGRRSCVWLNFGTEFGTVSGAQFQIVKPSPLVECHRDDPAEGKEPHDEIAERAEVLVEPGYGVPECSLQVKAPYKKPQGLDTSDGQSDYHRNAGDGDVVVELANRLD